MTLEDDGVTVIKRQINYGEGSTMKEIFTQLNGFDYTLLAIAVISLLIGLKRGLVREIISLIIWVVALVVAVMFTDTLAQKLHSYIETAWVAELVSFVVLLLIVLIAGKFIGWLISAALDHTGGGVVNCLFGGLFGLLRGAIIAGLVVFIISQTYWEESDWFQDSQIAHHLQKTTHWSYKKVVERQNEYVSKKSGSADSSHDKHSGSSQQAHHTN